MRVGNWLEIAINMIIRYIHWYKKNIYNLSFIFHRSQKIIPSALLCNGIHNILFYNVYNIMITMAMYVQRTSARILVHWESITVERLLSLLLSRDRNIRRGLNADRPQNNDVAKSSRGNIIQIIMPPSGKREATRFSTRSPQSRFIVDPVHFILRIQHTMLWGFDPIYFVVFIYHTRVLKIYIMFIYPELNLKLTFPHFPSIRDSNF